MTGIYRIVRNDSMLLCLAQGWTVAADLGPIHGSWSVLLKWCCGACVDGEAPKSP